MSILSKKREHILLVLFGALVLAVLSYRSLGCGVVPEVVGPDDPVKIGQSKDSVLPRERPAPSTKPIPLRWQDTGLQGERFHSVVWQRQRWLWVEQSGALKTYIVKRADGAGALGVQVAFQVEESGQVIDVAAQGESLLRILEQKGSRSLQRATKSSSGGLEWFTMKTFPEADTAPYGVTFLGGTPLFYGKKALYSIDPSVPARPKAFVLPFAMFEGAEHMKCSDAFCIAMHQANLPVMFKGSWKWDGVPGMVHWQVTPAPGDASTSETSAQKEQANKAHQALVAAQTIRVSQRLDLLGKQSAFALRENKLYWSCQLGNDPLRTKGVGEGELLSVNWAQKDLLLLRKDKLSVYQQTGEQVLALPSVKARSLVLRQVSYVDGLLFLEAQRDDQKNNRLYVSPYTSAASFALCR